MQLSFFVAGNPVPKGSFRAFNNGGRPVITNNNPRTKDWEMRIAHEAQAVIDENWVQRAISLPVRVTIDFYMERPKSLKKSVEHNIKRPDLDKLVRAALDGITGILINDDSQVVDLRATKNYAGENEDRPGAWLTIETL